MSLRLQQALGRELDQLRYEPTPKRVRARLAGQIVLDSSHALLVWEPRRVVPTYAVPVEDITAELVPSNAAREDIADGVGFQAPDLSKLPVLDPRIPFHVRKTPGSAVELRLPGAEAAVSGFRPSDEELSGYVILDFAGFDLWLEEDDEVVGHPHDPFHRIDVRNSSRHVQVMVDGVLLADTRHARLLFETSLPVRYYLPRDDVTAELEPAGTTTYCAYKGRASYWSVPLPGGRVIEDLAWSYPQALQDALQVQGYVAFFDEKVDVVLDGQPQPRPVTPWS